jgi:hypothetical protein
MINRTEQSIIPEWEQSDAAAAARETSVTTATHETLDSSLASIIGNARMIALDVGAPGRELAQRLAAIIDSAQKISLIVHQQFGTEQPADRQNYAGKSQSGGRTEGGAGERPCWT